MDLLNSYSNSSSESEQEDEENFQKAKQINFFLDESKQSDVSSQSSEEEEPPPTKESTTLTFLPSAMTALASSPVQSLYENEYSSSQKKSDQVLEQHVKMVESKPANLERKQICRMFKRGRCKYGNNCKMYHDKDIVNNTKRKQPFETTGNDDRGDNQNVNKVKKQRFGVTDNIVPSKKVLNHFKKTIHK